MTKIPQPAIWAATLLATSTTLFVATPLILLVQQVKSNRGLRAVLLALTVTFGTAGLAVPLKETPAALPLMVVATVLFVATTIFAVARYIVMPTVAEIRTMATTPANRTGPTSAQDAWTYAAVISDHFCANATGKRAKRVHGVATGDYVKFTHKGTVVVGHGSISHQQVALTKPTWQSVKASQATVLQRNHGYQVSYPAPELVNTP